MLQTGFNFIVNVKVLEDTEAIFNVLYLFWIIKNIELVSSVKYVTKTGTKFK